MPTPFAIMLATKTLPGKARPRAREPEAPAAADPELDALVREIIGRVADKWTMLALDALAEHGRLRFTRLGQIIGGVSQKMLTKTLRQMEADGLLSRTVFAVVPPRVEYELTELGLGLGSAFCGVWHWAERHRAAIMKARAAFGRDLARSRHGVDAAPTKAASKRAPAAVRRKAG